MSRRARHCVSRARTLVARNTSKRLHVTDYWAHIARDRIQWLSIGFGLGFSDTGLNRVSTQMTNTETMKTLRFGIEIEVVGLEVTWLNNMGSVLRDMGDHDAALGRPCSR